MIDPKLIEQWVADAWEKPTKTAIWNYVAEKAAAHGAEQAKAAMQTDMKLEAVAWQEIDPDTGEGQWGDATFSSYPNDIEYCVALCTIESAQQAVAAERAKFHDMDMHHVYKRTDYLLRITALEAALRQAVEALEKLDIIDFTPDAKLRDAAITAGREALQ